MTGGAESIRLTDVLTNAAALAELDGADTVEAFHLLRAVHQLRGVDEGPAKALPTSPLGRGGRRATVAIEVRSLSQGWFARLGSDPLATMTSEQLDAFVAEVLALPATVDNKRDW